MTGTGLLISYGINAGIAFDNGNASDLRDAAVSTATERTMGFLLNKVTGSAAGPIGWYMTTCEVLDDISGVPVLHK